jgi:hypothetical protein
MHQPYPEPILNERHETRINFLKKDKDRLIKRIEDIEERLVSTKNTLQVLLSYQENSLPDQAKSAILDYLLEEKSIVTKRLVEVESENSESLQKSLEQRRRIQEIREREENIEAELEAKFEAVLKESKEKEDTIQRLSVKSDKVNKEFKELAKNRLNSSINPKNVPDLLEKKENSIKRVMFKVHEYARYLENENKELERNIEINYKELSKLNNNTKYPFKIVRSLEEFIRPPVKNLVQADIRAKVEVPPSTLPTPPRKSSKSGKIHKIEMKLEEKFIKIESLCNELKTAEIINNTLKEDKNFLISSINQGHLRKSVKPQTVKTNFIDSYCRLHKRVVSNPLDYCSKEVITLPNVKIGSKNDLDLNLSKDLDDFSSVEDNFYEAPGDSIIDEILDI